MQEYIIDQLKPLAVPIGSVKPDPQNARLHNEANKKAIKKSIEGFLQRKPIVVNKNTGIIEAGNGLYQEMKDLGATEIAAVFVDDDDNQAKAFAIMDNRSGELSEWDLPNLKDVLQELDSGALDMDLTGFNEMAIEQLMTQVHSIDEEWQGMPEFDQKDMADIKIVIHFHNENDMQLFFKLTGIDPQTWNNGVHSYWFPPEPKHHTDVVYKNES